MRRINDDLFNKMHGLDKIFSRQETNVSSGMGEMDKNVDQFSKKEFSRQRPMQKVKERIFRKRRSRGMAR